MGNQRFSVGKSQKIQVLVEVAALTLGSLLILEGATSIPGFADSYAANNWNNQPSWLNNTSKQSSDDDEADGASTAPARRYAPRKREARNVSPFAPESNNLSLQMGQVFLMGDLSSGFDDSLGTALDYTYGVSDIFGFNTNLGYSNHAGGKLSLMSLKAGLRINLSWYDKVIPYLAFGLGFYRPSYAVDDSNVNSPILFGVHVGPGVDLEVSRQIFFGAALTFQDMFNSGRLYAAGDKRVGGTYTTFFLHLGYTF